ncbi:MAG TPA: hypothetical protein VKE40_24130 [Gemmataceae bacterium]|nr:hypothetical protein [Gemmataceae bacterium]
MDQLCEDYDDGVYSGQMDRIQFTGLRNRVRDLERKLEVQTGIIAALADVLRAFTGVADAELLARVQAAMAARQAAPPRICEQCGRTLGWKRPQCVYCEAPAPPRSVADLLIQ